jgi:hypothetical protein
LLGNAGGDPNSRNIFAASISAAATAGSIASRDDGVRPGLRQNGGSSRIHKTKSMEPEMVGNIAHLLSLLARAMHPHEEN